MASKFTMLHLVGVLALVEALAGAGEEKVFVVGHDWGAVVAWNFAMYRPDKIKALVNMSVVYMPRNPKVKHVDAHGHIIMVDPGQHFSGRYQERSSSTAINLEDQLSTEHAFLMTKDLERSDSWDRAERERKGQL